MAMFAAGLCAPGCGAVVTALGGGPLLGAVSVAAAIGYSLYTLSSKEEEFQDAEEEKQPVGVVKVAKRGGTEPGSKLQEGFAQKSFL